MRTTVTLDSEKLNELMKSGEFKSKAKAVEAAVEEFNRRKRIHDLFANMGVVDIDPNTAEWRHLECENR